MKQLPNFVLTKSTFLIANYSFITFDKFSVSTKMGGFLNLILNTLLYITSNQGKHNIWILCIQIILVVIFSSYLSFFFIIDSHHLSPPLWDSRFNFEKVPYLTLDLVSYGILSPCKIDPALLNESSIHFAKLLDWLRFLGGNVVQSILLSLALS